MKNAKQGFDEANTTSTSTGKLTYVLTIHRQLIPPYPPHKKKKNVKIETKYAPEPFPKHKATSTISKYKKCTL